MATTPERIESHKLTTDLARRLQTAVEVQADAYPDEHVEECWSIVADTIELMIDSAVARAALAKAEGR